MSNIRIGFMDDMFSMRACKPGGHVVVEVMSFISICVMGGNVLWEVM